MSWLKIYSKKSINYRLKLEIIYQIVILKKVKQVYAVK